MMAQDDASIQAQTWFEIVGSISESDVDIVAVPAIGADPIQAWTTDASQKPWLVSELREYIPNARVLLFDHGKPSDKDDLDTLGRNLLDQLYKERQGTLIPYEQFIRRPIFFICHSTGGLVTKAALVQASRPTSGLSSILTSCHGIAFLATPHQGSSYLSTAEYAESIHRLMRLRHRIPQSLRESFRPRHQRLWYLSNKFKPISSDMRIWTFLETLDSIVTVTDAETGNGVEFHVPIASIRSGLLDLEHEKETPLATDHPGTACFKDQEMSKISFLKQLAPAVQKAVDLSQKQDFPLDVEKDVMVQINGFFEDTALGVSEETPLKLWSTKTSLREYLGKGPAACLRARLQQTSIQPDPDDDSSLSSFERLQLQSSIQGLAAPDAQNQVQTSSPQSRKLQLNFMPFRRSMRRSQSSVVEKSPRIDVTQLSESAPGTPMGPIPRIRIEGTQQGTNEQDEDDINIGSEFMDPSSSQRQSITSISTNQSSRNQSLLPVPLLTRGASYEDRGDIPRPAPRFDRPEPGTEKLLWIHVPYTHTGWVPEILAKACMDHKRSNFLSRFLSDENWFSYHNRGRHLQPHARFVRPGCIHAGLNDSSPSNRDLLPEGPRLALYFPYLHWDTYLNLVRRRKVVEQRLEQGRTRPIPEKVSRASLEAKLIWSYLGSEPPIHLRRTLDQFGYPNLRSTVSRDDDQMLWKRTRKATLIDDQFQFRESEQRDTSKSPKLFMDGKVLMVDQLWLWIVDQKTVVTFFPNQEATTSEGKLYEQVNLHTSIYNELNGDLARRFETAGDLAALIVLQAVTVLLDKTLQRDLQVFRIFEESISILTESITRSFKSFRGRSFVDHSMDPNENPDGAVLVTAERDERDRREDLSALLELRDIIDELGTITKLFEQQEAAIEGMMKYYERRGDGQIFLETALKRIKEYHNQVTEMKNNSDLARQAVENLLDLKQKQANVDEARMARWQAEVTQDQSRSVMVFTIFSVIFLPLSFFTSLFGINAREWSGTPENLPLGEMFAIAGPTSFAIILFALTMAFSKHLREAVSTTHKITVGLATDFLSNPLRKFLHWDDLVKKFSSFFIPWNSSFRDRLNRYLGSRPDYRQSEIDIWKRHEDRSRTATMADLAVSPSSLMPHSFFMVKGYEFGNGHGGVNGVNGNNLGEKDEQKYYHRRNRSRGGSLA